MEGCHSGLVLGACKGAWHFYTLIQYIILPCHYEALFVLI